MENDDKLVGQTIDGRFRLDRLLGSGGMGKVYYGVQLSVDRPVAIKILRSDLSELPSIQQRFFREAKVLASLHHPNIVGLVDFGRDDATGALYMAMQYVDGKSLTDMVKSGRMPLGIAVSIARQVCSGLAEAHAAGIVHRDLKPDNIMLQTTAEGTVVAKILDFGIALPTGKDETRFTSTGAIVGTPHYMSPEQAQDGTVGPQSDLYAVGVILYEMVTGEVPFTGDTPLAVLFKTVNERHTPVRELLDNETARGPLSALMDALLEKDATLRPASASDVARKLDELRSSVEVPTVERVELLHTLAQPALVAPAATQPRVERSDVDTAPVSTRSSKKPTGLPIVLVALFAVCAGVLVIMVALALGGLWLVSSDAPPPVATSSPAAVPPAIDSEADAPEPTEATAPPPAPVFEPKPVTRRDPERPAAPVIEAKKVEAKKVASPKPTRRPAAKTSDRKDRSEEAGACQSRTCSVNLTAKDAHYACQRATCSVGCPNGGCRQVCQAESTCTFDCDGGGCDQVCFGGTTCVLSCAGGNCDRVRFGDADVTERD